MTTLPDFRNRPPLTYQHWAKWVTEDLIRDMVTALGAWTKRTVKLAQGQGHGYRDLSVDRDGRPHWTHPCSNAAERIDHWLWLADFLGDDEYRTMAEQYGRWMLDSPYSIYQGPDKSAHGMVYYWTEDQQYVTNYTIRIPRAFFRLAELTGDDVFRRWALQVGEVMLARQADTGLMPEAWTAANGWPDPQQDRNTAKINCRFGYAMSTFAVLYQQTQDERYCKAFEKLLDGMISMQNADGSLPHDLLVYTGECLYPCRKNHFMGYLLNGVAGAYPVFPDERLLEFGRRVASFCIRQYAYQWTMPYHHVDDGFYYQGRNYNGGKFTAITDPAPGLAGLYEITGDPQYLDVALKMFLNGYMQQYRGPHPDLYGSIPVAHCSFPLAEHWRLPDEPAGDPPPPYGLYVGGYYQFEYLRLAEILVRLLRKGPLG